MKEWIDVEKEKPTSEWHIVFVTDGKITCLARWIEDPIKWYGKELEDADGIKLDEEWHEPHWIFVTEIGPFIGNDECFGIMEYITHWIPLPDLPKV